MHFTVRYCALCISEPQRLVFVILKGLKESVKKTSFYPQRKGWR